jgi:hypothetical protein
MVRHHVIATSSTFSPATDPSAHRQALAALEAQLHAQGWKRDTDAHGALIGARFYRWRPAAAAPDA